MPTPQLVWLTRALKATILTAALAAALVVALPRDGGHPPERIATTAGNSLPRDRAVIGLGPDRHVELVHAIEAAQLAAFYEWAADQPPPAPDPPKPPARVETIPRWTDAGVAGDAVDAALARWFGDVLSQARAVAQCESSFDPNAVGGNNYGLMQINIVHRADFEQFTGRPWHDGIFDPDANVMYARKLYDELGWSPWSCKP